MFTATVGLFVKQWHRDIAHGFVHGIETSNTTDDDTTNASQFLWFKKLISLTCEVLPSCNFLSKLTSVTIFFSVL